MLVAILNCSGSCWSVLHVWPCRLRFTTSCFHVPPPKKTKKKPTTTRKPHPNYIWFKILTKLSQILSSRVVDDLMFCCILWMYVMELIAGNACGYQTNTWNSNNTKGEYECTEMYSRGVPKGCLGWPGPCLSDKNSLKGFFVVQTTYRLLFLK